MAEQFNYRSVLSPFMKQLLDIKEAAGYSSLRMKWILKEIDDYAEDNGLSDPHFNEPFFKSWLKTRAADSPRTIYAKFSVWHQLSTLMARHGCSCYVPRMPKQPKPDFTPYIFTPEQIAAIFAAADEYRLYDIRMGTALMPMPAILRLLYESGMRVSESLSLCNADVHFEEKYIHLRKTKNCSERIVPLNDTMAQVLRDYMSYRDRMPVKGVALPKALLFVKPDGTGISSGVVYQHFKRLLDKCGIPHIGNHHGPRVHDLRHTNAVHALVQMAHMGMDLYTSLPILSACLGHHSISATEQYVRLTISMYPELEQQCKPINAFVYPKVCRAYDYDD